ncbi:redoxin family protein [Vibrio scophthalmi]|uniref:redoxin domain-containing protein n=1 Tax=Vibrio scophthalmi TaxID=45658 RepID=UPI003AAAAB16
MPALKFQAGASFPQLLVSTLEGEKVALGNPNAPYDWKLVLVYRGQHCPLCTRYLNDLEPLVTEYRELGIDVIAVSADSEEQVREHKEKLCISFPLAYGLTVEQMQTLGVYISTPRSEQETDHLFAEPALFVINEKGLVQIVDVSNAPFSRPDLNVLLQGLKFIRDPHNNYPIRGTFI